MNEKRITSNDSMIHYSYDDQYEKGYLKLKAFENVEQDMNCSLLKVLEWIEHNKFIYVVKQGRKYQNLKLGYRHFQWVIYYSSGYVEITALGKTWFFVIPESKVTQKQKEEFFEGK